MLQASPETAPAASEPRDGPCPECGERFTAVGARQLFCSPAHRDAWHNRQTVRGRGIVAFLMAARLTRGGSRGDKATGKRARRDVEQAVQRWIEEDRAAGRMPADGYAARRYALGFERLL